MTHYTLSYAGLSGPEADGQAIHNIQEYLTTKQWSCLMALVGQATPAQEAEAGFTNHLASIETLNFSFGLIGVKGYPFHAFCRTYALDKYRAWMAEGPDPILTDDQGFTIAEEAIVA